MPALDFSSQATPMSSALDFSAAATPINADPAAIAAFRATHGADVPLPSGMDAAPQVIPEASLADRLENLSAGAGDAITGSLAIVPHALLMASGGLKGAVGLRNQAGTDFGLADRMQHEANDYQRFAQEASPTGATIGNILGIIPKLAAPEVLAVDAMSHGTNLGTSAIQHGQSVPRALALQAEGQTAGAVQNLVPSHVGGNLLTRMATGAVVNGGMAAGEQAAEHATAPGIVDAPSMESVGVPAAIGAVLAAALGRSPARAIAAGGEARLSPDPLPASLPAPVAPSGGLPRGADFRGEFTTKPDNTPPPVGTVRVDAAGNAVTPAQGVQTLVDAIAAGARPATALPEPVITVDRAGQAATTADQNAALQAPPQGRDDTLGLTAALRALVARDPRAAREGAPIATPALPAPAVTVDRAGTAMTSADFLARARQAQADAEAKQAVSRARSDLGITPDIERTQAARWQREQAAAQDLQAMRDAREAAGGELAMQGENDAPLWWMAAHGAKLDNGRAPAQPATDHAPIVPDDAPDIEALRGEIGWQERGGRLLRGADEGGMTPDVIGRTKWIGKPGPGGDESSFWRDRPSEGGRINEAQAHAAIDKYTGGQPLNRREQRFIDYARSVAKQYDDAYEADRAQFERDQADMTEADRVQAVQELRNHQADVSRADDAEALTLAQWVRRAHDAGVPAEHIIDATWEGPVAEQARRLSRHIADQETNRGTDTRATPIGGEGGTGQDQARPAAAGTIREEGERFALEPSHPGPEASPQVTAYRGGLFAPPTAAERNRAAIEAKDAQRNGLNGGRADTGDGGLFDGPRPQQADIEGEAGRASANEPKLTDTQAFRRWFGDSKVVDADGKPLTVYHGTGEDFDVFGAHHSGEATGHATAGLGHFFTESRGQAQRYAENASDGRPADERVIDVHLSIKNPAEWTMARLQRIETPAHARAARRNLEASGYDGIHIADAKQWIAFRSEQIKSASANRGTFDPNDPSMVREGALGVEASSRDMFTRTRGDVGVPHGSDENRNGRKDDHSGPASPGRVDAGGLRLRPDATPELVRRGQYEVDELLRRFGGSVLADTIARDFEEKGAAQLIGQTATSIEDFAALAQVYRNPLFETLHYVFVDDAGRVLGESAISCRLPSSSVAFPDGQGPNWVEHQAASFGATGVWLTHNHPSGVPTPSGADIRLTRELAKTLTGVKLLGHVVLDHTIYSTIDTEGNVGSGKLTGEESDPLRDFRGVDLSGHEINSPNTLALLGRRLADLTPENSIAVAFVSARNKITMATALPADFFSDSRAHDRLIELARRAGAHGAHLVVPLRVWDGARMEIRRAMKASLFLDAAIVGQDGNVFSAAGDFWYPSGYISSRMEGHGAAAGHQVFDITGGYDPQVDMPSRRPGESRADYLRRVMRKNGDEIKQAVALAKQQRSIGRLEMRAMWAKQARAADVADHAFAEARKLFDKAGDHANLQAIDEWENGRRVTSVEARQFFDHMQQAFDQRVAKIRTIAPNAMQQLIDYYFPHIWEDSAKALKWYQAMGAKRPLQGDRSFLKQRTWGTIKEGMASGLKPVSTNPVDLVMLKLGQMDKFIAFNEMRQNLQDRGWLRRMDAGERVPPGYARVDDPAFQIAGGLQGYYAVPELIAKDINNYLAPSLYRNGAWKSLRAVQNVLMSARLGWSMFHAGFTTTDNLVMHADVAARRFMNGDVAGGLSTLLKTPLTVVWSPIEGHKLNREWLGLDKADTHTAAVLDMLEQGGAHRTMSSTEYQNALPKLMRAVRRGALGDSLKQVLPAVGEASSWIIHHWLVPNQKMAARVMLAKFELDRLAGKLGKERGDYAGIIDAMHPDVVKQLGAHVVDAVDDRLGQMNYDNQFWNKTAREAAQAAIGAVGWQVGTVRTVTGGVRDLSHLWSPPQLLAPLDKAGKITDADMGRVSGRLTYLISLGLLMGGLGAITQYLLTGEGPSEVKDYFFPKTGRKNDDGSDERLQFPSYWQDHYKLATHPLQTAEHKIHPSIGMFMEAIANQDYYGVRIRDEDASWWKQAEQVGEYVAKGFLPYSWTGHQKLEQNHDSTARKAANFFGVTTAPASVSRTPFQAFVAEKAYAAMPQGARTQEQAEHSQQMHEIEAAMRRGEQPDMSGLSTRDQRNALRASRDEVPAIRFRRLGIEDKLRAYGLATSTERDEYHLRDIILRSNWHKAVRDLPEADREAVLAKIQALIP